jgi:hypothetical protein
VPCGGAREAPDLHEPLLKRISESFLIRRVEVCSASTADFGSGKNTCTADNRGAAACGRRTGEVAGNGSR